MNINDLSETSIHLIATGIAAIVCGAWMFATQGTSGIGWFAFFLFMIWNS